MKKDKQWLQEQLDMLPVEYPGSPYSFDEYVDLEEVKELVSQLDPTPDTPVVTQAVADWINEVKTHRVWRTAGFIRSLVYDCTSEKAPSEVRRFYEHNPDEVIRAWLDNKYEVEKRYRVILPTASGIAHYDYLSRYGHLDVTNDILDVDLLTEKEIKAIDEGYWAFRKEA